MATSDFSLFDSADLPDATSYKIGIVVSEWNSEITDNLLKGCTQTLSDCGVRLDNIRIHHVPGSFELALGAQILLEARKVDCVICLGSIVRGETPHFEFVSLACATGIKDVTLKFNKPVVFGVLTDDNISQARERSGGKHGNKGVEAAITALKMVAFQKQAGDAWMGM
ncbi:MAG: 6,7-dimethyl-8-ribityllumazine synthase [Flavobacteriales bacterium]|nr:6,7-dimethyl-8-ribityllumazine synthase [Flavobacteriales bacterium]